MCIRDRSGDMNELALTGRIFDGQHAEKIRFVSKAYDNSDDLFDAGEKLANEIASKNAHELSKIIDDPSIISFIKKSK